jgi:hypothetical protein
MQGRRGRGSRERIGRVIAENRLTRLVRPRLVVARQLRNKATGCRAAGSTVYAELLEHAARDVDAGGPCWKVLKDQRDERGSALPVRFMAAVHRLALEGGAPELAKHLPSCGGTPEMPQLWPAFVAAVEQNAERLRDLVDQPMQRNEVSRCGALLGGFLSVARDTGLPLRVLELGTSAGLNLRWDLFSYNAPSLHWGDPGSVVQMPWDVREGHPPVEVAAHVVERRGCDTTPLDPASSDDRLKLMSAVWADQPTRVQLLRTALDLAREVPAKVDMADASDWLEELLAQPQYGAATVVFHSSVMQFLGREGRERVLRLIDEAGRRATSEAPLAHLRIEARRPLSNVRLTTWPQGGDTVVAKAAPSLGQPVYWLAS